MRTTRLLSGLLAAESGNVMMLSALSMLAIAGGAGIATDTVQWTLWQRELQRAADTAAYSGALAKYKGDSVSTTVSAELGRYNLASLVSSIDTSPTGFTNGVKVTLTTTRTLAFSSLFLATPPTIRAEATAAPIDFGDDCARALEPTSATGITFSGSTVTTLRCGIQTNSSGSTAISAGGSSRVTASPVSAVGGIPNASNYVTPVAFRPYSLAQSDPYSGLPEPVVPNSCNNTLNIGTYSNNGNGDSGDGNNQVSPGCYRGIDIQGRATFQPGTYIIDGDFKIGAQAQISGDGVTFILTSKNAASNPSQIGQVKINGGAAVDLRAPTSGTYEGILFYQDRRAQDQNGNPNVFNGNSSSRYSGSIYFPAQEINWLGTTGMDTTCLHLVSRRITFSGNSDIDNICPDYDANQTVSGIQIRLVA